MKEYEAQYERIKGSRKLEWKPELGSVDLTLGMPDGTAKDFTVSPFQATIIWHFQQNGASIVSDMLHCCHNIDTCM